MDRRCFLAGAAAVWLAAPAGAAAEILTKGSFGGREAYLKRVQELSGALVNLPRADEGSRAEMRAIATTLSSAVKDMLFNEADARGGKVAPPASALRPPAAGQSAPAAGKPVPIRQVPDDWLLDKCGEVQDAVADLLALLEDRAEPISSPAIAGIVGDIAASVEAINRPGG